MSQVEVVRKGGSERSWKDALWTRNKDKYTYSAGTDTQSLDIKSSARSEVKQVIGVHASEAEDGKNTKKRGNRLPFKKFSISEMADTSLVEPPKALMPQENVTARSKSTSSLSNLTRRSSKIARSRSPSPGHRRTPSTNVSKPEKAVVTKVQDSPTRASDSTSAATKDEPSFAKANRSLSTIFTRSASSPQVSASKLRKARSIDRFQSLNSSANAPDLPTPTKLQKYQADSSEPARKKEELWNVFRNLDQEHSKFINKPNSFKAQIIRQSVLPFLRQYADHPSNSTLRVEDLDRRVRILNKWWLALLDMTGGRNAYAVSPSDRPILLDGLTGVMQRPEWRQTAATLAGTQRPTSKASSSLSLNTNGTEFLVESVLKNTREIFIQNLLAQMNFAVDRMSLRTVAASVVAFCGKAIAYAFFFCPGVADVLVRLWDIPQATLRRVLDEAGFPRITNLTETSASIADLFQDHIRHLSLKTLPLLGRTLRERRITSANLDKINWDGPWIGRWSGRDSDLFFNFVKHYHNLVFDVLGDDCTEKERICAPGAVLVYGQMLVVMDATISVHKNPSAPSQGVTFDDILEPNASVTNLVPRGLNSTRSMAENRMIMLLREILADRYPATPAVKISFAALFGHLLKAVTKRTSAADADACFTLCDFLEESMSILTRFFRNAEDPMAFLDWPFWLEVLKRLGESNNTMTEVRLYSFMYRLWGYITTDESKKRDLCLGWLLREDYAYRQFNHWCPMVRAYYHRLLIWRIARCDGAVSLLDLEIFTVLLSLLQKLFSQYLHKLSTAQQQGTPIPSSTPAGPAPGRRLLIIRDDSVHDSVASLTSLLAATTDHSTMQRLTSFESLSKLEDVVDKVEATSKKRFTFLRSLNPLQVLTTSTSSLSASPENSPPSSTHTPGDSEGTSTPSSESSRPSTPPDPTPDLVPNRSFKFSLEWVDKPYPLRMDRKIFPPRLPPSAQAVVPRDLAEVVVLGDAIPSKAEEPASRYVGVALAEWALLVTECAAFAERRRFEGVPVSRIETPMLGIEGFRKPVG